MKNLIIGLLAALLIFAYAGMYEQRVTIQRYETQYVEQSAKLDRCAEGWWDTMAALNGALHQLETYQ